MHCFKNFVNEAYFGVNASKNTRLPARQPMRATPMTATPMQATPVAAAALVDKPTITLQAPNIFNPQQPIAPPSVAQQPAQPSAGISQSGFPFAFLQQLQKHAMDDTPVKPEDKPVPMPLPAPVPVPAVTQQNAPTTTIPSISKPAAPAVAKTAPVAGKNGRLQLAQLTQVEPGHYLEPSAANKFEQMKTAAAKDGINLNINNAYRSYEKQVEMANRLGLYSQGGKAARPGTSNHGWGKAVDLNVKANPGSFEWLKQNASKYGFKNIPREPWHWEIT
jgi:LAS superfamily LD-carboxypeptidase LdcB